LEEINKTLVEIMTELNDKDRLIAIQKDYINILLKLKEINLNQNLMQIEVSQNNKQYESMSTKDPLTNCYNRHYFEKYKRMVSRSSTARWSNRVYHFRCRLF
jgi:hypothetical protein